MIILAPRHAVWIHGVIRGAMPFWRPPPMFLPPPSCARLCMAAICSSVNPRARRDWVCSSVSVVLSPMMARACSMTSRLRPPMASPPPWGISVPSGGVIPPFGASPVPGSSVPSGGVMPSGKLPPAGGSIPLGRVISPGSAAEPSSPEDWPSVPSPGTAFSAPGRVNAWPPGGVCWFHWPPPNPPPMPPHGAHIR